MIYKRDEGVSFLILGCWYQDVRQFNLDYSLNPDIPSEITFPTMTIFNKIRIKKYLLFLNKIYILSDLCSKSLEIKIYASKLINKIILLH